jgi:hypothetical protein
VIKHQSRTADAKQLDDSIGQIFASVDSAAAAEDLFIKIDRPVDVGDRAEMSDGEPIARQHLVALLFDSHTAH